MCINGDMTKGEKGEMGEMGEKGEKGEIFHFFCKIECTIRKNYVFFVKKCN